MLPDPVHLRSAHHLIARHLIAGGDPRCRHTVTALTRRHALIGASALALGAAAGCRGDADQPAESPGGRTVQTSDGEIVVPQDPQRVVVTDIYLVSTLYDLDLRPVGIPGGLVDSGALAPEVVEWLGDDVAEIGQAGEINREAVLALGPDLVIDQFAGLPAARRDHVYGIRFTGVSCYFHALAALDELESRGRPALTPDPRARRGVRLTPPEPVEGQSLSSSPSH